MQRFTGKILSRHQIQTHNQEASLQKIKSSYSKGPLQSVHGSAFAETQLLSILGSVALLSSGKFLGKNLIGLWGVSIPQSLRGGHRIVEGERCAQQNPSLVWIS